MMNQKRTGSLIAQNKKARHLYVLLDSLEAGIVLTGSELKSLRLVQINFRDSYVDFRQGEAFLVGLHIAPYANAGYAQHEPGRDRKLLLHAPEINRMAARVAQKGLTVVPVKLYFKNGRVKVEIATAKGKKLYDQRHDLKERAESRDTERELGRF
jgi:SsrA-binding protein